LVDFHLPNFILVSHTFREGNAMDLRKLLRKSWPVFAACAVTALLVRFTLAPARAVADESDIYRVEMVHNDPYKVQVGLNAMMKQGWYYVGSIQRTDGKVLLVFRKTTD
jgi:hypothetical protein